MANKEQFFDESSVPSADFLKVDFGFEADHIMIVHDGTGDITLSWDGTTGSNDGKFVPNDNWIQFDDLEKSKIFLKSTVGADPVRVWAWRKST